MDSSTAILIGVCLTFVGIAGIAARRYTEATRNLKEHEASRAGAVERESAALRADAKRLVKPLGRVRDSQIVGIHEDALRYKNGDLGFAYKVEMKETMFAEDYMVDQVYDEIGRMVSFDKPVRTVIQSRVTHNPDPGRAILDCINSRAAEGVHLDARLLQTSNLDYFRLKGRDLPYKRYVQSLWVRVPTIKKQETVFASIEEFKREVKRYAKRSGWPKTIKALPEIYAACADDKVVRRSIKEERQNYKAAETVTKQIEAASPLLMSRLKADDLWEAVYFGHNQNANAAPRLPADKNGDLRDLLCTETITGKLDYLMHGDYPVRLVSMLTPPNDTISAGCWRVLMGRPDIYCRHTIVTEYVYEEQKRMIKRLDKRIKQVRRTRTGKENPDADAALAALRNVRVAVTGTSEALVSARTYIIVYGHRAKNRAELERSIEFLDDQCERIISTIRQMPGANAVIEDPADLRVLYDSALVGEMSPQPTGREVIEEAQSLCALMPTEDSWKGAKYPHTVLQTFTKRLIGLDLYDRHRIPSPLAIVLAAPRGGKSVMMAQLALDVLASYADARVVTCDPGSSYGPLVELLKGRHLSFNDQKPVNIWDYPELKEAEAPAGAQIALVIGYLQLLTRDDSKTAEVVLSAVVEEVYRNLVPLNGPGKPKYEPTHSHFMATLKTYPFKSEEAQAKREMLHLSLQRYVGHEWLDQPTDPAYERESPFDCFALDALSGFQKDVRDALVYTAAARVVRAIGKKRPAGTYTPTVLRFDEMWRLREEYPFILKVLIKGARMGPKFNVVTLLATHAYGDVEELHGLTKTADIKIIGRQLDKFDDLVAHADLSEAAIAGIKSIRNAPGRHSQFMLIIGKGEDQVTELIQHELSPLMLWTITSNAQEKDARTKLAAIHPTWSMSELNAWLADRFPRGLVAAGLREIPEDILYS